MNSFKIDGKLGKYIVNLPENVSEISKDYLEKCTEHVQPAPDYVLVAVVYKDALAVILNAGKTKKPTQVAITTLFIDAGPTDSKFINSLTIGDKIIVAGSDLSLGHNIECHNNKITPDTIIRVCEGDKDIYKDALVHQNPVCLISFKLVPACVVHGALANEKISFDNPYIFKAPEADNN